ncbi:hypothetical protein NLJ89_g9648 [Agrocybe chaxingu]|uniref:60S ribosomal protein L6 n=1 Tax=Agrocybe chaxingu TaxID=84603 RepID=A0A9W8JSV1_9AGAR|nr:hypothetical protein NLJ89_g9648 [Agrocybe chaxingu]
MARSKELVPGIGRLSRSQVFAKRGLFKGPKKSDKPAVEPPAEFVEKTIGGEKNGGKRLVPTTKAPRFYPAEDVRQPKKTRKSPKAPSLRSSITPGTVVILLAGRYRGKRVVFLKQLASGLLLVTGPYKVNGVPLRRVNQAYVIATSTKVDISGVKVDDKFDDAYFSKPSTKTASSAEEEFFEEGKPKAKEPFPESKAADQKAVDSAILAAIKGTESLSKYLKASWGLSKALPLPPSLPSYATTIILVTVVSRIALLPISIWGKERTRRAEEIVMPEIEKLKPFISKRVLDEMKARGMRGDKKTLQEHHSKKCIELLTAKRKELFKEHKCSPLPSIIVPPLSQLPVFIGFTIMLSRLSLDPTPFDSESFLTLTSLAHPDPTMTMPVVLGLLTMANVESGNWVMNAAEKEQLRAAEEREAKRVAEGGKPRIHPGKVIKSVLRGLSVFRIIIAAMTPGSVTLYWVTSATFGVFQTWAMEWNDARRRRRLLAARTTGKPQPNASNRPKRPLPR